MNKYYVLIFALCILSSCLKAQFAPLGSKWFYGIINFQGKEDYFTYEITKDTSIADETYSKIVYNDKIGLESYSYLILKENSKTYYWNGVKKCLLFDSSKKSGDTLTIDASFYLWNKKKDTTVTLLIKIDTVLFTKSNSLNVNDSLVTFKFNKIDSVSIAGYLNNGSYTSNIIKSESDGKWLISSFEPITTGDYYIYIRCFNSPNYNYKNILLASNPCHYTNVGITDIIKKNEIKVYPNPNHGSFTISFANNQSIEILVYDVLGNLVSTFVAVDNTSTINLPGNAKGIYFISIQSDNGQFNSKIIVE
jgi:hypothetical protein